MAQRDAVGLPGQEGDRPLASGRAVPTPRPLQCFAPQEVLCQGDLGAVSRHFANLSRNDLRLRFGSAVSSNWLARYVETFFARPGVSVGVQRDGVCIALGEMRPWHDAPDEACDIALSVQIGFRGQGLGTSILAKLLTLSASSGFERAQLLVDTENKVMQRVCAKFGASAHRRGDQILYRIPTLSHAPSPGPSKLRMR